MIRFVFLDVDDTLLDFQSSEAVALEKTLKQFDLPFSTEVSALYHKINDAQWKKLERGELTRAEVRLRRFELLLAELGEVRDAEAVRQSYEHHLSCGHYFIDGAEALLETLYGKYRLFVASNGTTAVQKRRLASADIERYFDAIFLSEQIGCAKPQRAFFDDCFAKIPDFDASQAIILGDSLTSDIQGGINAGIKTCWFNPRGKTAQDGIKPDYEIATLDEFPRLLERI